MSAPARFAGTSLRLSPCLAVLLPFVLWLTALPVAADSPGATGATGVICIAPFHIDEKSPMGGLSMGPLMSNTPAPMATTVFTFVVDKRLKASVRNRQMGLITGVPADRKVKVEVRMDGKGFETFWLNLSQEPEHRACLWLYPGYWHWIEGWDAKRGCKCEVGEPAAP